MRIVWWRVWLLVGIASGCAILANHLRPNALPWICQAPSEVNLKKISQEDLLARRNQGQVTVIDARAETAYRQGHLAGAINLPAEKRQYYLALIHARLLTAGELVVYCESEACTDSRQVGEFLVQNGIAPSRIAIFSPGWERLQALPSAELKQGIEP